MKRLKPFKSNIQKLFALIEARKADKTPAPEKAKFVEFAAEVESFAREMDRAIYLKTNKPEKKINGFRL